MSTFNSKKLSEWCFAAMFAQTSYFKVRRQLFDGLRKCAENKGDYEMDHEDFQSIRSYLTHKQGALSDDVKLAFDKSVKNISDAIAGPKKPPPSKSKDSKDDVSDEDDDEEGEEKDTAAAASKTVSSAKLTPKGDKSSGQFSVKD